MKRDTSEEMEYFLFILNYWNLDKKKKKAHRLIFRNYIYICKIIIKTYFYNPPGKENYSFE